VTTGADPAGLDAGGGAGVFTYTKGLGNGLAQVAGSAVVKRSIPITAEMNGVPRISLDGRHIAYLQRATDHGGGPATEAVVSDLDGRHRRVVAHTHGVGNMAFDQHGRLRLLLDPGAGGSAITAPDSSRVAVRLRRWVAVLRYSPQGSQALSGDGWAEARDAAGHVLARRDGIIVLAWDPDGTRVLVRSRGADHGVAWWNVKANTLTRWRKLSCGFAIEGGVE
jgi:hypothetical protein